MSKTKETKMVKSIKNAAEIGASIGGAAIIGCLLKQADYNSIKGFRKLFIGVGVFGLAHAAGLAARIGISTEINEWCDMADGAMDFVKKITSEEEEKDKADVDVELVDVEEAVTA